MHLQDYYDEPDGCHLPLMSLNDPAAAAAVVVDDVVVFVAVVVVMMVWISNLQYVLIHWCDSMLGVPSIHDDHVLH